MSVKRSWMTSESVKKIQYKLVLLSFVTSALQTAYVNGEQVHEKPDCGMINQLDSTSTT